MISVSQFEMLKRDFSDCFEVKVIKQENLVNVINLLYDRLKEEVAGLSEIDQYTQSRMEALGEFEVDGILKPDYNTESSINDLANKFFILQEQVRQLQRSTPSAKKHRA